MTGGHAHLPLPVPFVRSVAVEWEWQTQARCRTMDPGLFFPPDQERGEARQRREEYAKQVCRQCPVTTQCASFALLAQEQYGVWGGLSETERLATLGIGTTESSRPVHDLNTASRSEPVNTAVTTAKLVPEREQAAGLDEPAADVPACFRTAGQIGSASDRVIGLSRRYRKFPPEFREETAKLVVVEGQSIAKVARDHAVSETTVSNWVRKYRENHTGERSPWNCLNEPGCANRSRVRGNSKQETLS